MMFDQSSQILHMVCHSNMVGQKFCQLLYFVAGVSTVELNLDTSFSHPPVWLFGSTVRLVVDSPTE